ncbi:MAG: hypothetical protein PHN39_01010 [Candidatus Pacebacteria bacterium]|nr:hypothetical protein [Candidatus Paceibacterota bacterium]
MKTNFFEKTKMLGGISLASAILMAPLVALAIGLVTEPIVVKNVLRGGEFQKTLNIINTQKENVTVTLAGEGDVADWVKFYRTGDLKNAIQEATIATSGKIDLIARFIIPKDTPNGTYKGLVSVTQKPKERKASSGQSVSIGQRVERKVTITVSDKEIIAVKGSIIPIKYDLIKNEPLKIRVLYDNQSNVSVTPQVQLKIKKDGQVVYSAIFPYPETESAVKPLATQEIPSLEIPTSGLADGKYLAEIVITQGQQKLFEKSFQFSVGLFNLANISTTKNGFWGTGFIMNWFIIGGAIALILIVVIIKLLKGNLKNNGKLV